MTGCYLQALGKKVEMGRAELRQERTDEVQLKEAERRLQGNWIILGVRGLVGLFKKRRDSRDQRLNGRKSQRIKGAEYGSPSQLPEGVRQEGVKGGKELKEVASLGIAKESEDTVVQEAGVLSKEFMAN